MITFVSVKDVVLDGAFPVVSVLEDHTENIKTNSKIIVDIDIIQFIFGTHLSMHLILLLSFSAEISHKLSDDLNDFCVLSELMIF